MFRLSIVLVALSIMLANHARADGLQDGSVCTQEEVWAKSQQPGIPQPGMPPTMPPTYPRRFIPSRLTTRKTNNYDVFYAENRVRSGIPLGGIGAGFVELRHDGTFYNWMIANNYPKGVGDFLEFPDPQGLDRDPGEAVMFFLLRFQEEDQPAYLRILSMHRSEDEAGVSQYNIRYIVPWLTAVDRIESSAQFPFIRFLFADEAMPLDVAMEAFSSFVPGSLDLSTTPGASFRFAIQSTSTKPLDVTLVAVLRNLVGYSVPKRLLRSKISSGKNCTILEHSADHVDPWRTDWGTMALGVDDPKATYYLGWAHQHPFYPYLLRNAELPNVDDTLGKRRFLEAIEETDASEDPFPWLPDGPHGRGGTGRVHREKDGKEYSSADIRGSLAVHRRLKPGESWNPIYTLGWHFPNSYRTRQDMESALQGNPSSLPPKGLRGHYCSRHFQNAAGVAKALLAQQDERYVATKAFVDALYHSDLPPFVNDLVNAQLPRFFTIAHLSRDADFGINDDLHMRQWGVHGGHNPDVSVYASTMILSLFPDFHRQMVEDQYAFYKIRVARKDVEGKTDRNINLLTTSLRHYQWTGDRALLEKVYPVLRDLVRAILEVQDRNQDGVPELHGGNSTYDNLVQWNLSIWIASNWVAGLRQLRVAAEDMQDEQTMRLCEELIAKTRKLVDERLWNGRYYDFYSDYDGLYKVRTRRERRTGERFSELRHLDPHLCFDDQLLGQLWLDLVNGGAVFDREKERRALQTVANVNFYPGIGLITLRDPRRADRAMPINPYTWIDQANTLFTGAEFATAANFLYAGMYDEAIRVLEPLDARHRKNGFYWNHQEAFNHYLRSMAGWMALDGALGLSIDRGAYTFSPKLPGETCTLFMSVPGCCGTFRAADGGVSIKSVIDSWRPKRLVLDSRLVPNKTPVVCLDGSRQSVEVSRLQDQLIVNLPNAFSVDQGQTLCIR